ncbi:MltF family protein [Desulfoplanes sp.]
MLPKLLSSKITQLAIGLSVLSTLVLGVYMVVKHERPDGEQQNVQPSSQLHPLAEHLDKKYTEDLPGLLEKRYIRVLTTVNRTNFFIDEGHLVGFEYSLLNGYQKFINGKKGNKGLRIVLEYIPVDRNELMPKLVQGYGDIAAAGLTITQERKKKVDFTTPYLTNVREVIVTHKDGSVPTTLEDLAGHKVYVRESSSYRESLVRLNKRLENRDIDPVRIEKLDEHIETESILEMVNTGAIPMTVADEHIARAWSGALPDIVVNENLAVRTGGRIAWMVRKNNPELLASLNDFLKSHKQGTLFGNIYFERYYAPSEGLKNPKELTDWDKLKKYKKVIRKYADKYGFDWLLILSMAFQESGLDNDKTSHAGAVGLMQIRPSTAADKNIGITNVRNLDNNVHAGVKYLHFLRTKYFDSPSIRPRDQIRFALAAYNAGPANIRKARKETTRMGLDPNRWFRNVELGALKTIGRETVQYVSNINKYYILYTTILHEEHASHEAMEDEEKELSTQKE